MSGGSLDYAYNRIDDLADSIASRAGKPLHRAFVQHLRKVSRAAHDLEWVFSCDWGSGDEDEAILAVISKNDLVDAAQSSLAESIAQAQETIKILDGLAFGYPNPKLSDTKPNLG